MNQLIHGYKERIFHQFARPDEKRRLLALLTHRPIESMTDQEAEEALKKAPQKVMVRKGIRSAVSKSPSPSLLRLFPPIKKVGVPLTDQPLSR